MSHDPHTPITRESSEPGSRPHAPVPTEERVVGHRSLPTHKAPDRAAARPDVLGSVAASMALYGVLTAMIGGALLLMGLYGLPYAAPTGMVAMGVGELVAAIGLAGLLAVRAVEVCVAWFSPAR